MDEDNSSNVSEEQTPPETKTIPEPGVGKAASSAVEESTGKESEHQNKPPKSFQPQGEHRKKRWLLIIIVLLLLAAIGAVAWSVTNKKTTTSPASSSSTQSQTTTVTKTYTPANVAYAFKGDTGPYTIYWRLASGGDRTPVDQKLAASETIIGSDVNGSNVAVATDKAIYTSTDGGKTYKAVIKLDANEQVTSVKFAVDGQSIIYADLPTTGGKNTVKSIDLTGSNSKDLFTSDKAGVFIIAYSSSKQQIIYREGCYNCDGAADLPVLRNLKTGKTTSDLIPSAVSTSELGEVAVSNDFSTMVYARSTANAAAPQQALGVFTGAPYGIESLNLSNNTNTQLATFGTKGEKNTNGTLKTRVVHVGFVAGTSTPYYSNDAQLYAVKSGTSSLIYTAAKPLIYIPFVGTDTVIAGSGDQTADYALVNYNVTSKKSTTIFSGDNNTVLFGVTTK